MAGAQLARSLQEAARWRKQNSLQLGSSFAELDPPTGRGVKESAGGGRRRPAFCLPFFGSLRRQTGANLAQWLHSTVLDSPTQCLTRSGKSGLILALCCRLHFQFSSAVLCPPSPPALRCGRTRLQSGADLQVCRLGWPLVQADGRETKPPVGHKEQQSATHWLARANFPWPPRAVHLRCLEWRACSEQQNGQSAANLDARAPSRSQAA